MWLRRQRRQQSLRRTFSLSFSLSKRPAVHLFTHLHRRRASGGQAAHHSAYFSLSIAAPFYFRSPLRASVRRRAPLARLSLAQLRFTPSPSPSTSPASALLSLANSYSTRPRRCIKEPASTQAKRRRHRQPSNAGAASVAFVASCSLFGVARLHHGYHSASPSSPPSLAAISISQRAHRRPRSRCFQLSRPPSLAAHKRYPVCA